MGSTVLRSQVSRKSARRPQRCVLDNSFGKAAPHRAGCEDPGGTSPERPPKAEGREEATARLHGPLLLHSRSPRGADTFPAAVATRRTDSEGGGRCGSGKEPLTASPRRGASASGGGESPRCPQTRAGLHKPQPQGRGVPRLRGDDRRAQETPAPDSIPPPSPPNR